MDAHNLCQTPTTYRLLRLEYLVGLLVAAGFFLAHLDEVRWWVALLLFAHIDLIGYLPGALAHRRSPDGRIPRVYYVLYNTMHSLLTQALVVGAWMWLVGPEWALLVVPIHLFGDRGLFGNFVKPFTVAFEPRPHPAVQSALADFATVPWHAWPPAEPGRDGQRMAAGRGPEHGLVP
ncbi:hypothetical protein [Streptomyces purpureus]|uniref:Membrane protein n=1 Tax=Streptomyces purpureus TaxID=1951 RepID=A0A918GX81_9ACTN|nr:hypothetical protein [Streptomyces purpureus]GGT18342.1 membrane protein [Streptomyces purpureus]